MGLAWDFFYRETVDLDSVIEAIRPTIKPDQVEVAEKLFLEAIKKQPGTAEALAPEVFHQQLTSSLVRLSAGGSDIGIKHIGSLVQSFPDKTEVLCLYLLSLKSKPKAIALQAEKVIKNLHTTEYVLAWMVRVLNEVSEHISNETLITLKKIAESPQGRWLVAVEVAKLLATRNELEHDLLLVMWNTCPAVFQVDLVVAAARMGPSIPWANVFVSSAQSNPIHAVVIRHMKKKGLKPTVRRVTKK